MQHSDAVLKSSASKAISIQPMSSAAKKPRFNDDAAVREIRKKYAAKFKEIAQKISDAAAELVDINEKMVCDDAEGKVFDSHTKLHVLPFNATTIEEIMVAADSLVVLADEAAQ